MAVFCGYNAAQFVRNRTTFQRFPGASFIKVVRRFSSYAMLFCPPRGGALISTKFALFCPLNKISEWEFSIYDSHLVQEIGNLHGFLHWLKNPSGRRPDPQEDDPFASKVSLGLVGQSHVCWLADWRKPRLWCRGFEPQTRVSLASLCPKAIDISNLFKAQQNGFQNLKSRDVFTRRWSTPRAGSIHFTSSRYLFIQCRRQKKYSAHNCSSSRHFSRFLHACYVPIFYLIGHDS